MSESAELAIMIFLKRALKEKPRKSQGKATFAKTPAQHFVIFCEYLSRPCLALAKSLGAWLLLGFCSKKEISLKGKPNKICENLCEISDLQVIFCEFLSHTYESCVCKVVLGFFKLLHITTSFLTC